MKSGVCVAWQLCVKAIGIDPNDERIDGERRRREIQLKRRQGVDVRWPQPS